MDVTQTHAGWHHCFPVPMATAAAPPDLTLSLPPSLSPFFPPLWPPTLVRDQGAGALAFTSLTQQPLAPGATWAITPLHQHWQPFGCSALVWRQERRDTDTRGEGGGCCSSNPPRHHEEPHHRNVAGHKAGARRSWDLPSQPASSGEKEHQPPPRH